MKKNSKYLLLGVFVLCVFIFNGCNKKEIDYINNSFSLKHKFSFGIILTMNWKNPDEETERKVDSEFNTLAEKVEDSRVYEMIMRLKNAAGTLTN